MAELTPTYEELQAEIRELRLRLAEAEETLQAIQEGGVDALVVSGSAGDQVYTLNSAEHPYRILVESMNEGAASLTPDGSIIYCNHAFSRITGIDCSKLVGTIFRDLIAEKDRPGFDRLWLKIDEGGSAELEMATPRGPVPSFISCSTHQVEGEKIAFVIINDVSGRKNAEDALKKMNEELEQRIADRTVELESANSLLRDSRRAALNVMNDALDARQQAEEATWALRESHERLKRVLEVEAVGVMFWDLNTGCLVDANDTFLKLMGYSRSDVESHELTWQKFTPPEYHEISLAEVRKFMATGRIGPYEKEYFRKDGTRQWLLFSGSSLGNNQCVEFCVDITTRKQAEEALVRSHEQTEAARRRLGAILDTSPVGVVLVEAGTGSLSLINRRAAEIYGTDYSGFDLYTHTAKVKVVKPDDTPFPLEELPVSRALRGEEVHNVEMAIVRSDGLRVPIVVNAAPLRDSAGEVIAGVATLDDITERKQAEEELLQSEERLRLAMAAARMASWDWHIPSGRTVWNEMHYLMMGYQPMEVEPSYQAWANRVHPDDIDSTSALIQKSMDEKQVYATQFRTLWPDGTVRWLEARGEFSYDQENRTDRCYGVMIDITDRKESEELIQRHFAELQEVNKELARFNDASVGRELRMIELKKEINLLCQQSGIPPRFQLDFEKDQPI
jgi:PAS domain S-box-containing protein